MKRPRAKGNKAVREVMNSLASKGWLCDRVEKTGKFIKVKDLFGLFDLCCVHPQLPPMFIQVTSNRPHNHKLYKEFAKKYPMSNVFQFVKVDRKGWKMYYYTPSGEISKDETNTL